jgi:hypothetical protein
MVVAIRRMFWVVLLGGAGFAGWTVLQRRSLATPASTVDAVQFAGLPDQMASPADAPAWLAPVDGACPDGYPIKANANSGIYHVPGGRFYDRTIPERCYAHTADAEADGYRRAKA